MNKNKLPRLALLAVLVSSTFAASAAEIAIVASAKSSAGNMTTEQASQVFLGKASAFADGHKTVLIDQAEGTPVHTEFYTKVTGKDQAQLKAYWSRIVFTGKGLAPKELPDSAAVKKAVAADPDAVGYIEKSAVDASVKVLLVVN